MRCGVPAGPADLHCPRSRRVIKPRAKENGASGLRHLAPEVEEPNACFFELAGGAALANALAAAQVLDKRASLAKEREFVWAQVGFLESVFSRNEGSRHGLLNVSLPCEQLGHW